MDLPPMHGETLFCERVGEFDDDFDDVNDLDDLSDATELMNSMVNTTTRISCRNSVFKGCDWINELLTGHPNRIYENLRMDSRTFRMLCNVLRGGNYLSETYKQHVKIEESLAIFLYTVGHSERQRVSAERFQHSTETINRHVKHVMRALNKLAPEIICPGDLSQTPEKIIGNSKFDPYFKNCIGAIDGTAICAWARSSKLNAFRSRKSQITQNVLAVCDFDMCFTFIHAGWEGSANDSRVILDAISRPELQFPMPPTGKYYVVDSGYTNMPGFLAPYRKTRYHLNDFRGNERGPRTRVELFNYRHSSLRNVIERCFGVLKKRFAILSSKMPNYMMCRQSQLVIACCVLHNFIRKHAMNDRWFNQWDNENIVTDDDRNTNADIPDVEYHTVNMSQANITLMGIVRDGIAEQIWNDVRHL